MFAGMLIGAVGWGTCKYYTVYLLNELLSTQSRYALQVPISLAAVQPSTPPYSSPPSLVSSHHLLTAF